MAAGWTQEDENELLRLVKEGKGLKEIAAIMGRTYNSVESKKRWLLSRERRERQTSSWSIDDKRQVWYLYHYGVPLATIQRMMFNRKISTIERLLKTMKEEGEKPPTSWTPEEEATLKELINAGALMDILFDTFPDKTMLEIKYKKMAMEILHNDIEPSRQACMVVPSFKGFFKPGKEYEINIEYVIDDDDTKTTVAPKRFIFEYRTKGKTPLNVFRRKGKKYHLSLTDYEAWNRVNPKQLQEGGIVPPNNRIWEV